MFRMIVSVIGLLVIIGVLLSTGCAPAATPSATTQSKPSSAATSTTAAPRAAEAETKPATSQSAKPGSSGDWKAEWDKTVAEAKKEGTLFLAIGTGELYRQAVLPFQKAYPDIQLQITGIENSALIERILPERQSGRYLWDVSTGGASSFLLSFKPQGILDPLRPALILPEILDNSKWLGGFDDIWMDSERQYVVGYSGAVRPTVFVNRQVVPESQLNSIDQILDPKWKGKIVMQDPRMRGGAAGPCNGYLLMVKGEDWQRKLLSQDIASIQDGRQAVEMLVRGQYSLGVCLDSAALQYYRDEGVADHIKPLDRDNEAGASLTGSKGNVALINKPPHPNAAKVFVNWLLSQEGQKAYTDATSLNSMRLDVQGPPETAPDPNKKYKNIQKEEFNSYSTRALEIANQIIK